MIGWASVKLFIAFGFGFLLAEQITVDATQYNVVLNIISLMLIPLVVYGGKKVLERLDGLVVSQASMNVQLTQVCTIVQERNSQQAQINALIKDTNDLRVDIERIGPRRTR